MVLSDETFIACLIAFLKALAFEEPCALITGFEIPKSSAPPYSEESKDFLNALSCFFTKRYASFVKIPAPKFYVVYNGSKDEPEHRIMRLSEAFEGESHSLELLADSYNINLAKGKKLLDSCYELRCYSVFVAKYNVPKSVDTLRRRDFQKVNCR